MIYLVTKYSVTGVEDTLTHMGGKDQKGVYMHCIIVSISVLQITYSGFKQLRSAVPDS